MIPSSAPFFRERLDLRAAGIAAHVEERERGNLPVSPRPLPGGVGAHAPTPPTYVVQPRKPGYRGRLAHRVSMRERRAPRSGDSPRASTMTRPISRKSSSSIPRIVAAGVPMRTPLATVGGRASNGTVLRLTV